MPFRRRHFKMRFFSMKIVIFFIKISLKYVRKVPIDNKPALVKIMARRRPGDKLLSEPMMCSLPRHICVTRPQWVKQYPTSEYSFLLFQYTHLHSTVHAFTYICHFVLWLELFYGHRSQILRETSNELLNIQHIPIDSQISDRCPGR